MPTPGPATGSGEPRPRVGPSAGRPGGPGGQASSEEGPPWHGSSPVPLGAAELGGVSVARPRLRDAMGAGQGHSSDMNLNDKGVVQNCGELRISKCCTFLGVTGIIQATLDRVLKFRGLTVCEHHSLRHGGASDRNLKGSSSAAVPQKVDDSITLHFPLLDVAARCFACMRYGGSSHSCLCPRADSHRVRGSEQRG
jgi:hypothetical protein